jgi:hypothetical protein
MVFREQKIYYEKCFDNYRKFKLSLDPHLYCTDCDQIEIRGDKIVALLELKSFENSNAIKPNLNIILKSKNFQLKILNEIATKINAWLYLVVYTENLQYFLVYDCDANAILGEYNQEQYVDFLKNLKCKNN